MTSIVEVFNISLNGHRIHRNVIQHNTDGAVELTHPLDYLKKWIEDSEFILSPSTELTISYLRNQFDENPEFIYGNKNSEYLVRDFFSVRLGNNKQMNEQTLWLLGTGSNPNARWFIRYENDMELVPLIMYREDKSMVEGGTGFIGEHDEEFLSFEERLTLLNFCNARTNKGTVKRFSKNIQITTTRSGEDTPTTIEFTIKGDKIDEKYVRDFEEWKKMCDELKATHPESDDMYAELWTKLGYTVEFIEFDTHTI